MFACFTGNIFNKSLWEKKCKMLNVRLTDTEIGSQKVSKNMFLYSSAIRGNCGLFKNKIKEEAEGRTREKTGYCCVYKVLKGTLFKNHLLSQSVQKADFNQMLSMSELIIIFPLFMQLRLLIYANCY